jgi:hypothetical protein
MLEQLSVVKFGLLVYEATFGVLSIGLMLWKALRLMKGNTSLVRVHQALQNTLESMAL